MALLEIEDLSVNYGAIQAVRGLTLEVNEGEVVTLIGANGAGKTTTLRAVSRILRPVAGRILFGGRDITRLPPDEAVKIGIAQSPEGRQVLARQSIQDNLELGAFTRSSRAEMRADIEKMFGRFPRLVREIFAIVRELNEQGVTILLVEQNAKLAMQSSHRTYVLEAGQMTFNGNSADLVSDERVLHAYLGG